MKPAKTAYFVLGPESSGTRMLTEALCRCGIYGDAGHVQRMDDLDFAKTPERIVFRRSLPHGGATARHWPAIAGIVLRMREAGYRVVPILILRDLDATVKSQVAFPHVPNEAEARYNVQYAVQHALSQLAQVGLWPVVVPYEPFVRDARVREQFFHHLELPVPDMSFFDANEKYRSSR